MEIFFVFCTYCYNLIGSLDFYWLLIKEILLARCSLPDPSAPLMHSSSHHPISSFPNTIVNKYHPVINPLLPIISSLKTSDSASFSLLVWMLCDLKLCSVTPKLTFHSHLFLSKLYSHFYKFVFSMHIHNHHT